MAGSTLQAREVGPGTEADGVVVVSEGCGGDGIAEMCT